MSFIHDDFMLESDTARRLYHEIARDEPIVDYHCHLPPGDIADNRRFRNLFEIWLEGDHYKWRAMRSNGVDESHCTGAADPYEKFLAYARTVPHLLRNPLYHWSHLELKRYFGIDMLLDESSAPTIWEIANEQLKDDALSVNGILNTFKVEVVCTTDDPVDKLEAHEKIRLNTASPTRVFPTFRPDNALKLGNPGAFQAWCDKLAAVAGHDTGTFYGFLQSLEKRHDFFHSLGGRLSDHGLERCYTEYADDHEARTIFDKVRSGKAVSSLEQERFGGYMMVFFGHLDAEKGWTKQLHLGAMRSNNSRLHKQLGPDTGFDSIGDYPQGVALSRYLDRLDQDNLLPKTILYNLNPVDNYLFATMIGNFQDGSIAGKVQFGSGWWFNDQKEAMEWQMNALSNLGLLSRFVGMLTDSRSFLSFPRHEYFRRVLCNLVGNDVERGLIPMEWDLYAPMVKNICYRNARDFFGFQSV